MSNSKNIHALRNVDLSGITIPVPTPFHQNKEESVDYEKFKENLLKWEQLPLKGYCIGGTYSERVYLKDEELIAMLKITKSSANTSKVIIAGTTCESTGRTISLSQMAAEAGADAVMIQTPHYFKFHMTDDAIVKHFETVANEISIPVIIYNNPSATGIDISLNCIERLANHPNICGVKDVEVFKLACCVEKTRNKNFHVLAASAGYILPALTIGCTGSMNGLAVVLGQPICDLYTLAKQNKWEEAMRIQQRLIIPDLTLLRPWGPAGLKAAMDLMGYYGGICRKPSQPVSTETKDKIREVLTEYNFLK